LVEVRRAELMSRYTSFRIGGPVSEMWFPKTTEEFITVLADVRARGISPLVIGNGTNLLVSDELLDIVVIRTFPNLTFMNHCGETTVEANCGTLLHSLASFVADKNLSGLEFAHGIPGTIGGAIFMNAGAYGGEMNSVVRSVRVVNDAGEIVEHSNEDCRFGYRESRFCTSGEIIVSAVFDLTPDNHDAIFGKMHDFSEARRAKQPLQYPSAGSAFKRPPAIDGKPQYAAAMIDECGLKGYRVGGAAVSDLHAGFVVNLGGATFDDVMRVLEHVRETVFKTFGTELEIEPRIIK